MNFIITSSKNDKFKYFKSLKQKKFRTEEFTVEGKKSVMEALASDMEVSGVIVSESFASEGLEVPENIPVYALPDSLFAQLSSTETPSGIMCTIRINRNSTFNADFSKAYIYCDRISDPGNLGTIIRTADAAAFGGVILSPECVELYNPKTVRSSMGSFFRIPLFENIGTARLLSLKQEGFQILSGALSADTINYTDADFKKPTVIVVGNESNGVSKEVLELSDRCIKIPIVGGAESLNAAVAAAVIMYEVLRQRS